MVWGRRNGIGAFWHHTGTGYIAHDLGTGQMSADAGLCALTHLNLHCCTGFQIVLMNAKTAGCHLNYGSFAVDIEIFMEATFTGIIVDPQFRCSIIFHTLG